MIVHVSLPIPVTKTFSYIVPDGLKGLVKPLIRVQVPFRNRKLVGVVTGTEEGSGTGLKEINDVLDPIPLIDGILAQLIEWASYYYVTPLGLVFKYALPATLNPERYLAVRSLTESDSVLDGMSLRKACDAVGKEVLFRRASEGSLELRDTFTDKRFDSLDRSDRPATGTDQALFVGSKEERLEHYASLIAAHVGQGGNVLMLLPDHHAVGRYFSTALSLRFPGKVFWYGTSVKGKARMEAYFRARNEHGLLLLGSKSCVFLPLRDNTLIIVERPEEDEYRNEEGFKYNAGIVAMKRAEIEHSHLVLGSAAPPLEIFKGARDGTLRMVERERREVRNLREIIISKGLPSYDTLPGEVLTTVGAAVEAKEILAVYTPRRDYSSRIQCLECNRLFTCSACSGMMKYQKDRNRLVCTACDRYTPYEEKCTRCGSSLIRFSLTGAEYLEEKLMASFKNAHVVRIAGETFDRDLKRLMALPRGSPVILVGTYVLSKLHDLPADKLMLIGWENLLRTAGFRAQEKMFQTLTNLIDALTPGEVCFVMERKRRVDPVPFLDSPGFLADELRRRELAGFPPYGRIFLIEMEKTGEERGLATLKRMRTILQREGLEPYMTGPLLEKRRKYRWRIILRGSERLFSRALSDLYALPGVQVEADPLHL
jgi:primosomal protein N' (replication factor Y) (superfamily II helicase)